MVVFAHSVIGASHIKKGTECQDASLAEHNEGYTFIAVADGHGGEQYFRSKDGSRFAVEAAKICMTDPDVLLMLRSTPNEKELSRLKKSIISQWNMLFEEDIQASPFTDDELSGIPEKYVKRYKEGEVAGAYGTTLIAALQTDSFLLVLHIGDGSCVAVNKENGENGKAVFSMPVPECTKSFLNATTSLCENDAIDNFRHYYSKTLPAAVMIATDGIDDCFGSAEKIYGFYRVILTSFSNTEKTEEDAKAELFDYLPMLSERGSRDDISIGMMADINAAKVLDLTDEVPVVAEEIVEEPAEETLSQAELIRIVKNYNLDRNVRYEAAKQITDIEVLAELTQHNHIYEVCKDIFNDITDQAALIKIAKKAHYLISYKAVKKISAPDALIDITKNAVEGAARKEAVKRVSNQEVLANAAINDESCYVREEAVKGLTDQEALFRVAEKEHEKSSQDAILRKTAVNKITDAAVLNRIINGEKSFICQWTAEDHNAIGPRPMWNEFLDLREVAKKRLIEIEVEEPVKEDDK